MTYTYVSFRANNARSKAHSAEIYAKQARSDSLEARISARTAAPDFRQPGKLFSCNYIYVMNPHVEYIRFRRREAIPIHIIRY